MRVSAALLATSLVAAVAADPVAGDELAAGKFLVAKRHLLDPNFTETVVLLVEHGPGGAMGLVVNRPSDVRLEVVLRDVEGVAGRPDAVYLGGPVGREMMLLLMRAEGPAAARSTSSTTSTSAPEPSSSSI